MLIYENQKLTCLEQYPIFTIFSESFVLDIPSTFHLTTLRYPKAYLHKRLPSITPLDNHPLTSHL